MDGFWVRKIGKAARPWLVLAPLLLASAAQAQVGGPIGGPVGPVGGPAAGPARVAGVPGGGTVAPDRGADDDAAPTGGVVVNAQRGFDVGVSFVSEYGSNLIRLGDGIALSNGLVSRSDFRFRPAVNVRFGQPLGRQLLFVNGTLGRDFYARNTILNKNRYGADAGLAWELARCTGRAQGSYTRRQAQFELDNDVIDNPQERSTLLVSGSCPIGARLAPSLSASWNKIRNKAPGRDRFDTDTFNLNGALGYAVTPRLQLGLNGSYTNLRRSNLLVFALPPVGPPVLLGVNTLDFYSATVNATYAIGPSLKVNGSVGLNISKEILPPSKQITDTVYSAGVSYTGPRISASLNADRAVQPAPGGEASVYVTDGLSANLGYQLGSSIDLYAGWSHRKREFRGSANPQEPLIRRSERSDRFFVGASTDVGRLFTIGIEGSHVRRRSDPSIYNYSTTNAQISLRANF
ncbi:porin family protein [Sandaracinobacteroides saxicola]|uniref:Outer membrane beta-barrel protein n=1 Tax=Sandaracinobacteroides saxicola TaxID=2759707 RepID=A0A7G5IFC3_9SPHN|nr:hypothetical protein [Sandaracinobacteroides saxicola]QMW22065.1 hypothetical protein H3309_11895 [Sandaracinobacteroides saxicola]